jgi:ADP-ribose pyrophosphatase YjhB (NUDIX family)
VRVKARAVIWLDGKLVLASQRVRGRTELSILGGRVNQGESVTDALVREVTEETGLSVNPERLLYVAEIVSPVRAHDLEVIFLARTDGPPRLNGLQPIDLLGGERPEVKPPILEEIARDHASSYRDTPRWLGNLWRRRSPDK